MFDSIIYRFLDWLTAKIEKTREYLIRRSLPKGETPQEWAKKNAKANEKSYK